MFWQMTKQARGYASTANVYNWHLDKAVNEFNFITQYSFVKRFYKLKPIYH